MALDNWKERTDLLIGSDNINKLQNSSLLIAGLGGVGGFAAEILCRAGIGKMTIIDADIFSESNINRQIGALQSTVGKKKTEVIRQRLSDINPQMEIISIDDFIIDDKIEKLFETKYDYVIDAIDSLSPKVFLIFNAMKHQIPLVSSMGAGGRMDPLQIRVADISKSHNDGLARMLRKRLHKMGIYKGFNVVFSTEIVKEESIKFVENERNKKTTLGTISYMPMMFGAHMAAVVIKDLLGRELF